MLGRRSRVLGGSWVLAMVSASRGMVLIQLSHLRHWEVGVEAAGDWKGADSKWEPVRLGQGWEVLGCSAGSCQSELQFSLCRSGGGFCSSTGAARAQITPAQATETSVGACSVFLPILPSFLNKLLLLLAESSGFYSCSEACGEWVATMKFCGLILVAVLLRKLWALAACVQGPGFPLCTWSVTALTRNAGRMRTGQTLQCKFWFIYYPQLITALKHLD